MREKFSADVGLAIAGDYDTRSRSAGGRAFIAVDIKSATCSTDVNYPGRMTQVARRIVNHALVFLIKSLK